MPEVLQNLLSSSWLSFLMQNSSDFHGLTSKTSGKLLQSTKAIELYHDPSTSSSTMIYEVLELDGN